MRYNDGSSYTLNGVIQILRYQGTGYWVRQDPPLRCTKRASIQHFIPAHNVDVVSYRPARDDRELAPPHTHDEPHAWYEQLWAWLWGHPDHTH